MFRLLNRPAGFAALLSALIALPITAFAATSDFFGPVIPQSGACLCTGTAMDWGCVLQVVQGVTNMVISFGTLLVILVIAYGGFMLMVSGSNPGTRTEAKNRLLNAVVGLALVLFSWLIVDYVMKIVYDPTTANFGPWNSILAGTGGDECIKVNDNPLNLAEGSIFNPGTLNSSNLSSVGTGTAGCAPSTIQQAAASGNYTLTDAQANTLSCIAKYESSCGRNRSVATTAAGKPTTAAGTLQIIIGANDKCHSLNLPVCTAAAQKAGFSISGNLNCSTAFSGGAPKASMTQLANACKAAAANINCNASAAACLMSQSKKDQGFSPWTADPRSVNQKACVAKYAGG